MIAFTVLEVNRMLDSSLFQISTQLENDIFTLVHLIAMSTTISNPILYGWLNTNLKHLFRAMIPYVRDRITHLGNSNLDDGEDEVVAGGEAGSRLMGANSIGSDQAAVAAAAALNHSECLERDMVGEPLVRTTTALQFRCQSFGHCYSE